MNTTTEEKYDEAIAHFIKNPEEIVEAWHNPHKHVYGCLFSFMNKERNYDIDFDSKEPQIGCPSLIKGSGKRMHMPPFVAANETLTTACMEADLPEDMEELLFEPEKAVPYLAEFARIQRLADKLLEREKCTND